MAELDAEKQPAPSGKSMAAAAQRPQQRRRLYLALSFILLVVIPTILGAVYYSHFASDRYAASTGFAVRGVDSGGGLDSIGALTGLASTGSTTSDSYIILRYLASRDLIDQISEDFDLRGAFSAPEIDYISRLDPTSTVEEFVQYWQRRLQTSFDSTSGIITFEVQAFDPDQSHQLALLVLDRVQQLVNGLSSSARHDSVRFAQTEVARAETRLREAQLSLQRFRADEGSINLITKASLEAQLISGLEIQLVNLNTQIASIIDVVDATSPVLTGLQRDALALKNQIDERQQAVSSNDLTNSAGSAEVLATYENLEIERTFAQQTFASALSSLENARIDAGRLQRYLAVYSHPLIPEEAIYPYRIRNIFLIALVSLGLWAIGTLITYAVRDHIS